MFYGTSPKCLWEMDDGEAHRVPQGEGCKQGDPMMPLLYSLGQHGALEAANDRFTRGRTILVVLGRHIHCHLHRNRSRNLVRSRVRCTEEPLWHPRSCREDKDLEAGTDPRSVTSWK